MKKKVLLLVGLLLALVLAISLVSIAQADLGGPVAYGVNITEAHWLNGMYLVRAASCPTPCNTHGVGQGYTLFAGHGATQSECMNNATQRAHMTESARWESWGPDWHPLPGNVACIWWCCQPAPAYMYFHWEFRTVTD